MMPLGKDDPQGVSLLHNTSMMFHVNVWKMHMFTCIDFRVDEKRLYCIHLDIYVRIEKECHLVCARAHYQYVMNQHWAIEAGRLNVFRKDCKEEREREKSKRSLSFENTSLLLQFEWQR